MKFFQKKETEEQAKVTLEEAEKEYKKLQYEIDELKQYDHTLCPMIRYAFSFGGLPDIHNGTLHVAIQERILKLETLQKDIEV